jgi:uncharacterized membrane protein YecN with MAPEG domain
MNTIALVLVLLLLTLIAELLVDVVGSIVTASRSVPPGGEHRIPSRRERGGTRRILQGLVAIGLAILWASRL